jgi:hypothetical protein
MTEDERQDLLCGLADLLSEGCSLPFGMSDELDRYIWRCRRAVSMVMVDIARKQESKRSSGESTGAENKRRKGD